MKREPLARALVRAHTSLEKAKDAGRHNELVFFKIELQRLLKLTADRLQRRVMGFESLIYSECGIQGSLNNKAKRNFLSFMLKSEDGTVTCLEVRPVFGGDFDFTLYTTDDPGRTLDVPVSLVEEMNRLFSTHVETFDTPLWPFTNWFRDALEERGCRIRLADPDQGDHEIMIQTPHCEWLKVKASPTLTQYVAVGGQSRKFIAFNAPGVLEFIDQQKRR